MEFLETPIFTRSITKLLSDEGYFKLQLHLAIYPESGDIIIGSGGIRKLRWPSPGIGKRGGLRIIYYFISNENKLFMLYAYSKSDKDDLTASQLKQLKKLVEDRLL